MPRFRQRLKRTLFWLGGLFVILAVLGWLAARTDTPAVPDGVRKETRTITLTGVPVRVDLYWPAAAPEAPLAVVAHGFSRGRRNMTGWGGCLAHEGFLTAVLDQPWWLAHVRNSRAICELQDLLRSGKLELPVRAGKETVLVGMSMGGLTTLLAAHRRPVDAWIGLDPVDVSGGGVIAARDLKIPCAILSAEPGAWNWNGNPGKIQAALPGEVFAVRIKGSTHCDSEWPNDMLGQIACGWADVGRRQIYQQYLVAFLRARIFADPRAEAVLREAAADARVIDLRPGADQARANRTR